MKSLKNFGRDNFDSGHIINAEGNNFKINEFTSLLGCIELDRVKSRIERRTLLLDRYIKNLKGTSYRVLKQSDEGVCANYKAIVVFPMESSWLKTYCKQHNISLTGEVYKIPIHHQPLYKDCFSYVNLPNTDYYYNHHICPPLYPELSLEEIDYICDVLKNASIEYEK
jgi:dTDP-4-amino-4,6-dideoxygalactose transaminase